MLAHASRPWVERKVERVRLSSTSTEACRWPAAGYLLWGDNAGLPTVGRRRLEGLVARRFGRANENVDSTWHIAVRLSQPLGGDGRERLGLGQVKDEEKDVGVGVRQDAGPLEILLPRVRENDGNEKVGTEQSRTASRGEGHVASVCRPRRFYRSVARRALVAGGASRRPRRPAAAAGSAQYSPCRPCPTS